MTRDPRMIALTTEEAVAAIEAAAWTERVDDEAYRKAVEALEVMIAGDGPFTGQEIRAVIAAHVPAPRRLIHTFAPSFGADWTAESAVALAREPGAECAWTWNLMRHDLMIASASGRTVYFEVTAPEPLRARLLEAERAAIAEACRD